MEEYRRRGAQAIAEVERIPDRSLSDPGVKQRIAHVIEQSVERVSDGRAVEDGLTAESLARMLVDAGGPREPGHSTEWAFRRLADLRTAIAFTSTRGAAS
ncbi:hypothetical protein [Microbacterium album]|uniref:Uncharacterized protein n=1 Tax=Microbacterium album TaxID=2053191 RepID=A0A917IHM0_9MICO|nr:hypothetical protein [Microbacterium album]GGH47472.1 hypothetical protein GCM10010921_24230 [Microbacterium album]